MAGRVDRGENRIGEKETLMNRRSRLLLVVFSLFCLLGATSAFAGVNLDIVVVGGERPVSVILTGPGGTALTTESIPDEFRIVRHVRCHCPCD